MQLASHPALVVVDMQNGFVSEGGFMQKIGLDTSSAVAAVPQIKRLLDAARAAGIPVVFSRYSLNADYSDAGLMLELYPSIEGTGGMVRDTWDAAIVDELTPAEGEIVVDKTRYSAFFGTNLKEQLDELGVDQLIITGVTTNVCVEGTGRDAFAHDFKVIMVSDATGAATVELHEGTLASVAYGMGTVATVAEVEQALAELPQRA
jgi:ureidoacrylate peracid hydrolase